MPGAIVTPYGIGLREGDFETEECFHCLSGRSGDLLNESSGVGVRESQDCARNKGKHIYQARCYLEVSFSSMKTLIFISPNASVSYSVIRSFRSMTSSTDNRDDDSIMTFLDSEFSWLVNLCPKLD